MKHDKYILDETGSPVAQPDLMEWAVWFDKSNRHVAKETIGEATISTVFLGMDHQWGDGPPVLWETMVFGGSMDQEQDRCSGSREDAEAMHKRMVDRVKAALP